MLLSVVTFLGAVAQHSDFAAGAPSGTGLEWMTIASVVLPALLLVALAYVGRQSTV